MNLERGEVAALLKQQATLLDVKVLADGPNYTYFLEIDSKQYQACTLSSSSDYFHYRLNLDRPHITAIVVGEHTTCAPLPVLALDEGYFYAPGEIPRWYNPTAKRTRKNAMVIVGGLLSGVDEAWEQVEAMRPSTRYRYLARMQSFLSAKQGRQLAV